MGIAKALGLVTVNLAAWETVVQLAEHEERQAAFARAEGMCLATGKPLLVVGTPRSRRLAWLLPPGHACGDTCVDLDPIVLDQCENGVVADVRDLPFPSGYFGASVSSHVLEHMPGLDSLEDALRELHRVSCHVEVVCPHRTSMMAWVTKGHRLFVHQRGDGSVEAFDRQTREKVLFTP